MRERTETNGIPSVVLDAISQPVIMVSAENCIAYANLDAEQFFRSGSSILARNRLESFLPFGSPLLALVDQVRTSQMPVNEYRVDVSSPRLGAERIVDIYVAPVASCRALWSSSSRKDDGRKDRSPDDTSRRGAVRDRAGIDAGS